MADNFRAVQKGQEEMKFFVMLEIVFITARIAVIFFPTVPIEAVTALTWACAVCGIIAGVFIVIEMYNKINGKKDKD